MLFCVVFRDLFRALQNARSISALESNKEQIYDNSFQQAMRTALNKRLTQMVSIYPIADFKHCGWPYFLSQCI